MKRIMIGIGIFLIVFVSCYLGLKSLPYEERYVLIAEFDEVPESTSPMEQWINNHKGVHITGVLHEKIEKRWAVTIHLGITRNGWGNPPPPNIEKKCEELGYRGISGRFCPDRNSFSN